MIATAIEAFNKKFDGEIRSLHGCLVDTGNPDVAACPDDLCAWALENVLFDSSGYLWRLDVPGGTRVLGDRVAISPYTLRDDRRFEIRHNNVRWLVGRTTLFDRVYGRPPPAVGMPRHMPWHEYRSDAPAPDWLGLPSTGVPGDAVIDAAPADQEAAERADRLFYGI